MKLCLGCFNSVRAIGPSIYFPVVSKVCSLFYHYYHYVSYALALSQSYWTVSMDGLAINSTIQLANGVVAVSVFVDSLLLLTHRSNLISGNRQWHNFDIRIR